MKRHPARRHARRGILASAFTFMMAAIVSTPAAAAKGPLLVAPPEFAPDSALQVAALSAEQAAPHHMQRPLDEQNGVVYDQQFGNSVGVGVLLGPLGVAANIAATKKRTETEAEQLFDKVQLDVSGIAREALAAAGFATPAEGAAGAPVVTPMVRIASSGGEPLHVSAWLRVDQVRADGKPWIGSYGAFVDEDLVRAEVIAGLSEERRARLETQVREAFAQAARLLNADAQGTLQSGRQLFFKAPKLSPRFDFQIVGVELPATEGRTVLRTANAVVSLPTASVQVVKVVEPKG